MKDIKLYAHNMKKVGEFRFANHILPVYNDLEEPLFKSSDVRELVDPESDIKNFNQWVVKQRCEHDEYYLVPIDNTNDESTMQIYIDERGLYTLLATSRNSAAARLWRRAIFDELRKVRKEAGLNIVDQFEEWDRYVDDYYFDDATGKLMKSVTVAGGDVEQVLHTFKEV